MSEEYKNQLKSQIAELEAQLKPLQEKLRAVYAQEEEITGNKVKRCHQGYYAFKLDELIFAATSRCPCGAGLAYPKSIGMHGHWDCSDILLGRALSKDQPGSKQHTAQLPFVFYEIKSEQQPSDCGATTRPAE